MKTLWTLFVTFMRIGGLTFGGGYAMLPMLQQEVVGKLKWTTEEELLNYYAVGQCTPGIIAINTATFIGYKQKGILGACAATAGIVFPSLVIIGVIAGFIQNFADNIWVQHAFAGIRVAVGALVISAVVKMWKAGIKDGIGIAIFVIALVLSLLADLSPMIVVLFGIVAGIGFTRLKEQQEGK